MRSEGAAAACVLPFCRMGLAQAIVCQRGPSIGRRDERARECRAHELARNRFERRARQLPGPRHNSSGSRGGKQAADCEQTDTSRQRDERESEQFWLLIRLSEIR